MVYNETMTRAGSNQFLLVYGTVTGNAQAIAEEVRDKAPQHGLQADLHNLSMTEKKFGLDRTNLIVIIVSTTGDGEVPDEAQKFWRRLKKKTLPSDHYKNLTFSLLGLGDSNYSNFCNCGKMVDKRLTELGAQRLIPTVYSDEAVGLETMVDPWMESLWPNLRRFLGLPPEDASTGSEVVSNGLPRELTPNGDSNDKMQNDTADRVQNKTPDVTPEGETNIVDSKQTNGEHKTTDECVPDSNGKSEHVGSCDSGATGEQSSDKKQSDSDSALTQNGDASTSNKSEESTDGPSLKYSSEPLSSIALNIPSLPPPFLKVEFLPSEVPKLNDLVHQNGHDVPAAKSSLSMATITKAEQMTRKDAVKKSLRIELDIQGCGWTYEPGDSFGIICPNPTDEVNKLIERLGLQDQADTVFKLTLIPDTKKKNPSEPPHLPPEGGTIRHVLTTCCDIRTAPKKAFLRMLVEYTSDDSEKRRLQELCSKQGAQHYSKYIRESAVSLLDILLTFPSCQPPIDRLLELLPRLQPRPYSASSCAEAMPGKLQFLFNVVQIPTGEGRHGERRGICTGWLDDLTRGQQQQASGTLEDDVDKLTLKCGTVPVYHRSNQHFRHPSDLSVPIIMIGPGCGVAPFIGFLQLRELRIASADNSTNVGESWLFFGCRHKERDFLFKNDMEGFAKSGALSHLKVSFSRDEQPEGSPCYVQDNLQLHQVALAELICDKEAVVYVCGDANNMAKNVTQTFVDILGKQRGMKPKDAEAYVMQMRLHKRYLEDVWT